MNTTELGLLSSDVQRILEQRTEAGVWLWDYATRTAQWSDGLYRLFGLKPGAEPSYSLVYQATHPDDRIPHGEFAHMIEDAGSFHREFRVIWPDGRIRWVASHSEVFFDSSGKPLKIVGIDYDITIKKELSRRKDLSEQRLRVFIQIADSIVFTALPNSEIVDVNNVEPSVAKEPSQYTRQNWTQFIHPEDMPKFEAAMQEARQSGGVLEVEHRIRMLDNTYRWRLTRAAPVHDSDHVIREYIGFSKDIEAKKRAQISLNGHALTGAQVRAARGIANLSVRELAERACVSVAVIRRIEELDRGADGHEMEVRAIRETLERAGVEFFNSAHGKPGVRPR